MDPVVSGLVFKISCLGSGLFFCFLSYRLFIRSCTEDTNVRSQHNRLALNTVAALFALFGAGLICFVVLEGLVSPERTKLIEIGVQLGILGALLLTLLPIQRSFAAGLLRDRYQMFMESWEVSPGDVSMLMHGKHHLFVEKDMDETYLKGLQCCEDAATKFLLIVQLYEYLAFAHALAFSTKYLGRWSISKCCEKIRKKFDPNYTDPYGPQWVTRWVEILIEDDDFKHVHNSYRKDHPEFYCFIEKVKEREFRTQEPNCKDHPTPWLNS